MSFYRGNCQRSERREKTKSVMQNQRRKNHLEKGIMIQSTYPKGWQGLEEPWRQCQGKFQHQDQEGDPNNRQLVQLWKWNRGLAANQLTINMYHRFSKCWVEKNWCHGKGSQQDWPEEKVEQLHKAWTRWSAAQGPEGKTRTQNAICVKLSSLWCSYI